MPDFQADINAILGAADAWADSSFELEQSEQKAKSLTEVQGEVTWGVFQDIWNAHVKAATYMQDRLREGNTVTNEISTNLVHVANVFKEQDERFSSTILNLDSVARDGKAGDS